MAERKIIRGVFVEGKKTYTPGMEDELASVLSQAEVDRLTEKGYLEGKWTGKAKEPTAKDDKK